MAVITTYSFINVAAEFGVNVGTAGNRSADGITRLTKGNLVFAFQTDEAVPPNQDLGGRRVGQRHHHWRGRPRHGAGWHRR